MGRGKVKPIYLLICFYMYLSILIPTGTARVMLMGGNVTLSFGDIEAIFALPVERDGISGVLHLAEPLDACSPLTYKIDGVEDERLPFALIIRGGCTFDDKVRAAQEAGFKAAIVYDNEDNGGLVAMAGNSEGINICAVFVSKASGVLLKRYIDFANMELWIIPSFDSSSWSIIVICFISVVAMVAVLGTCFFIRRHQIRRARARPSRVREFHGMSSRLVKALPSLIFDGVFEDNCTSQTCAICLEDYNIGEKLRVLPCHHKFHAACVDSWLTTWRTFCPVCKRDARTTSGHPLVSECTPLLSSSLASPSSSTGLSSMRSLLASSAAIQRALVSSQSPSVAQAHYFSTSPLISYRHIPGLSLSRSSIDLSNATSRRPHAFHLFSSHSLGYPSLSPFISRHFSFYFPSPSNASLSYVGSTGRRAYLRHHGESEASFYPFASTQSLPGC